MSLLELPDEILGSICRELSYEHPFPAEWLSEQLRIECPSPALRSLSLVNRLLRQICLPLLFAYLDPEDIVGFAEYCSANTVCLQFARMLTLRRSYPPGWDKTVRSLLPSFKRVACVNLGTGACDMSDDFFEFISALPTVSTILVEEMVTRSSGLSFSDYGTDFPDESLDWQTRISKVDLSKVVLFRLHLRLSHLQQEFPPDGIKIIALNISDPEGLDEGFGSRIFNGLCELALQLQAQPVSFTWLPTFSSAHPHLHKIHLSNPKQASHVPPFVSPFFDEIARLDLQQHLVITSLYLSRTKAESQSIQQWNVTRVSLVAPDSRLIEILLLLSSSFSSIEDLSVDLRWHKGIYNLEDTIAALSYFPFVQKLRLEHIFNCLEFGDELEYDRDSISYDMVDLNLRISTIKKGLTLCASRLAEAISSLEDVHFKELDYVYERKEDGDRRRRDWHLRGCLHACGVSRDITGDLTVSLTGMLSPWARLGRAIASFPISAFFPAQDPPFLG
ncbi:hypothetical protein GYMLUDRAFT_82961 [Collybiopsis luxurians FD-317 M1]|nr:hypothetical protein GYMLUDRAFT_82961 [Collybiopsis luxurians FD-317 M1]